MRTTDPRAWRSTLVTLVLFVLPSVASAQAALGTSGSRGWRPRDLNPALTLGIAGEYALQTRDAKSQKYQQTAFAELTIDPTSSLQVVTRFGFEAEVLDNIDPGPFSANSYARGTRPLTPNDVVELALLEFFVNWTVGPMRVRAGKQQVVWGEADGLKVLDLINPQDFREFILLDFEDSRIPIWSVRVDFELGSYGVPGSGWMPDGSALQLIFVADPTVHNIPGIRDLGGTPPQPFAPTSPLVVPTFDGASSALPVDVVTTQRQPEWSASNLDVGGSLVLPVGETELAFYYLWHIDDFPVVAYGPASLLPSAGGPSARLPITLENRRYHVVGASGSRAIGDWVFRGEMTYGIDRALSQNYSVPAGVFGDLDDQVAHSDDFGWVLGVDYFGLSNSLLSVQVFQNVVIDHRPAMLKRPVDTTMTFYAERRFLQERLRAELIYLLNLNDADGLVRPRLVYDWNDYLKVWVGGDVFHGQRTGLFGQYVRRSRVVLGFSFGWTSG